MMTMEMRAAPRVPDEELRRRARVMAYRLACGELVSPPSWDPVWEVYLEHPTFRVAAGAAEGAVPYDWAPAVR